MPLFKLNTLILKKNERILTPESIPSFCVPPTLESYRNSINKRRSSSIVSGELDLLILSSIYAFSYVFLFLKFQSRGIKCYYC